MFSCQHDKSQEPFIVDGEEFFPVEEYVHNDVVNYESYYSNGEVKKSLTLRDNEADGLFSSFDSLGNTIRMEHYRMGVLQGERKVYDSRGSLQYLNNYKDGKRDGYQISFDASSDTISFNYCYKDSIIYSSGNQKNSFKEQILPFIKLLKDTHQVSDTLAVGFGLPIDENLVKDKSLFLFLGIDEYKPAPANLLSPVDSIRLIANKFNWIGLKLEAKGPKMLYGYIGERGESTYKNYQVFRRKIEVH